MKLKTVIFLITAIYAQTFPAGIERTAAPSMSVVTVPAKVIFENRTKNRCLMIQSPSITTSIDVTSDGTHIVKRSSPAIMIYPQASYTKTKGFDDITLQSGKIISEDGKRNLRFKSLYDSRIIPNKKYILTDKDTKGNSVESYLAIEDVSDMAISSPAEQTASEVKRMGEESTHIEERIDALAGYLPDSAKATARKLGIPEFLLAHGVYFKSIQPEEQKQSAEEQDSNPDEISPPVRPIKIETGESSAIKASASDIGLPRPRISSTPKFIPSPDASTLGSPDNHQFCAFGDIRRQKGCYVPQRDWKKITLGETTIHIRPDNQIISINNNGRELILDSDSSARYLPIIRGNQDDEFIKEALVNESKWLEHPEEKILFWNTNIKNDKRVGRICFIELYDGHIIVISENGSVDICYKPNVLEEKMPYHIFKKTTGGPINAIFRSKNDIIVIISNDGTITSWEKKEQTPAAVTIAEDSKEEKQEKKEKEKYEWLQKSSYETGITIPVSILYNKGRCDILALAVQESESGSLERTSELPRFLGSFIVDENGNIRVPSCSDDVCTIL